MAWNDHLHSLSRLTAGLCLALCAVGGQSGAADEIHYFADERGVHHFSNVPADPRYRPYLRATAEAGVIAAPDRPSVILFAPPLVAPGSEFAANVLLAAPADVYGWVDITFDPAALTLGAVSVEHGCPQPTSSASKCMVDRRRSSRRSFISVRTHRGSPRRTLAWGRRLSRLVAAASLSLRASLQPPPLLFFPWGSRPTVWMVRKAVVRETRRRNSLTIKEAEHETRIC